MDAKLVHPPIEWIGHDGALGYRNRIRLRLDEGQPAFFNPQKAADCAVLQPALKRILANLEAWTKRRPKALTGFAHMELRAPDVHGRAGLKMMPRGAQLNARERDALDALAEAVGAVTWCIGDEYVPSQEFVLIPPFFVHVPLSAFVQVNPHVNDKVLRTLRAKLEAACAGGARTLVDAYAGAGNLGLVGALAGLEVTFVERDAAAVLAAGRSAADNGVRAEVHAADAVASLETWAQTGRTFDVALINPPRAGFRGDVARLAAVCEREMGLLYCRAESFVRDVAGLCRAGFQLSSLQAFDMFPHTDHFEVLGWLRRVPRAGDGREPGAPED